MDWCVQISQLLSVIAWGSPVPNFTQIGEEIRKELVDGHLLPEVNYVTELIPTQLILTGQFLLKRNSYTTFRGHLT